MAGWPLVRLRDFGATHYSYKGRTLCGRPVPLSLVARQGEADCLICRAANTRITRDLLASPR
jgi:hypothetical protein